MEVFTTVELFNQVLSRAAAGNYYRCEPSKEDSTIVVLSMPKKKGDNSKLIEVLRYTLLQKQPGARTVYFTQDNDLARQWYKDLSGQEWPGVSSVAQPEGASQATA